jgi:hypothetical protein
VRSEVKEQHTQVWVSFSEAAHWILTEGRTKEVDHRDPKVWINPVTVLVSKITSGKIAVIGRKNMDGLMIPLEASSFVDLAVEYPYERRRNSFSRNEWEPYLSLCGIDPENDTQLFRRGLPVTFRDSLMQRLRTPHFINVQVRKSDVAKEFPFPSCGRAEAGLKNEGVLRSQVRDVFLCLWPNGKCPLRKKERDEKIRSEFGKHPPSQRTIRRALADFA